MATRTRRDAASTTASEGSLSSPVDQMLLAALERGGDSLETGRFLVTFKEGAVSEGVHIATESLGMRVADAREFSNQAISLEAVADADAVVLPEIGVAVISGAAAQERSMSVHSEIASDSPIEV